jgi:hypothetical protein
MSSACKVGRGRALPWALAAVVTAAIVAPADDLSAASSPRKEQKRERSHLAGPARGVPLLEPYVELDANKMPFGSAKWWEQMRRDGSAGGETP